MLDGTPFRRPALREVWHPERDGPNPQVYFINSNTHTVHPAFWTAIGADVIGDDSSGEIVFNPTQINPNGVIGGYSSTSPSVTPTILKRRNGHINC